MQRRASPSERKGCSGRDGVYALLLCFGKIIGFFVGLIWYSMRK